MGPEIPLQPIGSSKLIPHSSLLVSVAFALPITLSIAQARNYLSFTLLVLPHWWGSEGMAVWCLVSSWAKTTTEALMYREKPYVLPYKLLSTVVSKLCLVQAF